MAPRISVITPSFNQAEFLPRTLESVAAQTYAPVEHLVYDPGSTDASREIARTAPGVTLIAEPDKGQADAVARGMIEAKGDIIAWLNSDDEYFDDGVFATVAAAFLAPNPPDILFGDGDYVDRAGAFIRPAYVIGDPGELQWRLMKEVGILQPATFISKALVERIGPVDRDLRFCMDYEFWIRAQQAGARFGRLSRKLAKARYYSDNKTFGQRGDSLREVVHMTRRRFGFTHRDWLQRLADFEINANDGILREASATDPSRQKIMARAVDLNARVNGDYDTALKITASAAVKAYQSTAADFIERRAPSALDYARPVALDTAAVAGAQCYSVGPRRWAFDRPWLNAQLTRSDALFEKMKRERRGDVCAIVGNGPSLKKATLSDLAGVDTFVSNYAFLDKTLARVARYLCVTNYLVAEQEPAQFNLIDGRFKLFPYWLSYCLTPTDDACYVRSVGHAEFSLDFYKNISWRSTVTFFAMQMAYAIGYRKVVMTGFDHSYIQPKSVEGDLIKQSEDDPNHFDPTYFKGKAWQAADTDNMEAMYRLAKDAFEADGREIVNCTVGGKLELFRRGSLADEVKGAPAQRRSHQAAFPRTLIIDHTQIGDGTATGEIKANLFATWPADRLRQIAWSGADGVVWCGDGEARRMTGGLEKIAPPLWAEIGAFDPEIVLFRPVPDTQALHDVAMNVVDHVGAPLALWIMDDWPASLAARDPAQFEGLDRDWRRLLARSAARLSISEAMSAAFSERYGASFIAIANGVDAGDWPAPQRERAAPFKVRYSGSLAENMSLDSLRLVAEAVERLASGGVEIVFEINTRQLWIDRCGDRFASFARTTLSAAKMTAQDYRRWLSEADALVIAYNFDLASIAYVKYSLANKLPECLASGAPLLAVGPSEIETLGALDAMDCAARIKSPDAGAAANALKRLIDEPTIAEAAAGKARAIAFAEFDIASRRKLLAGTLARAASGARAAIAFPAIAKACPDETRVVAQLLGAASSKMATVIAIGADDVNATVRAPDRLADALRRADPKKPLIISAGRKDFGHVVTQGFAAEPRTPDAVILSATIATTSPALDATLRDAVEALQAKGYSVYASNWRIGADGRRANWLSVAVASPQTGDASIVRSLIAFRVDPGFDAVRRGFIDVLRSDASASVDAMRQNSDKPDARSTQYKTHAPEHVSGAAAAKVSMTSARAFAAVRFIKRSLSHFWMRRAWTIPALIGVLALIVSIAYLPTTTMRLVAGGALAFAMLGAFSLYAAFRMQSFAERLAAENAALRQSLADTTVSIGERFSSNEKSARSILASMSDIRKSVGEAATSGAEQTKTIETLVASVKQIGDRDADAAAKFRADLQALRSDVATFNQRYGGLEEVTTKLETALAATQTQAKSALDLARAAPANNASFYQRFNRRLTPAHIEEFNRDWKKRLSVNVSQQLLGYMAARACTLEAGLEGRLATSIEDILLRTLVCLGVKTRDLQILEIGTLFGAGAAIMYDALAPHFGKVRLTLLDPLDGYYDAAQKDILTGQPVNEETLLRNLRRAGASPNEITLIKRLSTDVEAMREAGAQQYDVLVIDGDHSYAGVKTDFENYSPFVRLGGYIIIDDYGSPDWPDVTRYVDEEVSKRTNVTHVGTSWRTCVYRVVTPTA